MRPWKRFIEIAEAATGSVLLKMVFSKISQILQENACAGVSFYQSCRSSGIRNGKLNFACSSVSHKFLNDHVVVRYTKSSKTKHFNSLRVTKINSKLHVYLFIFFVISAIIYKSHKLSKNHICTLWIVDLVTFTEKSVTEIFFFCAVISNKCVSGIGVLCVLRWFTCWKKSELTQQFFSFN